MSDTETPGAVQDLPEAKETAPEGAPVEEAAPEAGPVFGVKAPLAAPAVPTPPLPGSVVMYYEGDADWPFGGNDGISARGWTGTGGTRWHPAVVMSSNSASVLNLKVMLTAQEHVVRWAVLRLPTPALTPPTRPAGSGWAPPPAA